MAKSLEIPRYIKRIGMHISGGADSAILLYELVNQINPDQEIYIITGMVESEGNFTHQLAKNVVEFIKKKTGTTQIVAHEFMAFDKPGLGNQLQTVYRHRATLKIVKKYDIQLMLGGLTMNPPLHITELLDGRDKRRDNFVPVTVEIDNIQYYRPYANENKKYIAELFKEYDLIDSLLPETWSCEGGIEKTNHYTTICKECWWCRERKWAFGNDI